MRITESKLRKLIRSVISESMDAPTGEIDVDELCLDAIEHFYIKPYEPNVNHRGDGQYNAFVFRYCFDKGMMDGDKIQDICEEVRSVLRDFDSVSTYLMGNQTQRGMKIAQTFVKGNDLIRGMKK